MSILKMIDIKQIDLKNSIMARDAVDWPTVGEYCEALKARANFPPIDLFESGKQYLIADGLHRYHSHKQAKLGTIYANIHKGSAHDYLRFALRSNLEHGLRRTNDDKRKAADIALKHFANLSDNVLAEMCGVSAHLIRNRRDASERPGPRQRTGFDGIKRPYPPPLPPVRPPVKLEVRNHDEKWFFRDGFLFLRSSGPFSIDEVKTILLEFEKIKTKQPL